MRETFLSGDLAGTYGKIEGKGWFAEGMRGRIATLLLWQGRAETHFAKAAVLATRLVTDTIRTGQAPTDIEIARAVLVDAYAADHDLVFYGPSDGPVRYSAEAKRTSASPVVDKATRQRDAVTAMEWLSVGEHAKALDKYEELCEQDDRPDVCQIWHLGRACAYANLGCRDSERSALERAEDLIWDCKTMLAKVRGATALAAVYSVLQRWKKRQQWRDIIDQFDCPTLTKDALYRRSKRISRRSVDSGSIVLI